MFGTENKETFFHALKILNLSKTSEHVGVFMALSGLQAKIPKNYFLKERPVNYLLLLLVTRPLPKDGGMIGDHGASETGQLPKVWTRGRRKIESRHRVSGAKSP